MVSAANIRERDIDVSITGIDSLALDVSGCCIT
jgi:hypothetical protein